MNFSYKVYKTLITRVTNSRPYGEKFVGLINMLSAGLNSIDFSLPHLSITAYQQFGMFISTLIFSVLLVPLTVISTNFRYLSLRHIHSERVLSAAGQKVHQTQPDAIQLLEGGYAVAPGHHHLVHLLLRP